MKLQNNQVLNRTELSEFFQIAPSSFTHCREEKLEELKEYAEYELTLTPKGNFKSVKITKVYLDTYARSLRTSFLSWLTLGGAKEVMEAGGDGVVSLPTIVNYYCEKHGIPYNGPHYLLREEEGRGIQTNRKITGSYKVENKRFSVWHYLYRLLRSYSSKHKLLKNKEYIDCCANSFNPCYLKVTGEIEKAKRQEIYDEVFGKVSCDQMLDLIESIEDCEDRDEILSTKLMRNWTNKEKRQYAANRCKELGVLFRKGYEMAPAHSEEP